jgi:hypothetical protein
LRYKNHVLWFSFVAYLIDLNLTRLWNEIKNILSPLPTMFSIHFIVRCVPDIFNESKLCMKMPFMIGANAHAQRWSCNHETFNNFALPLKNWTSIREGNLLIYADSHPINKKK